MHKNLFLERKLNICLRFPPFAAAVGKRAGLPARARARPCARPCPRNGRARLSAVMHAMRMSARTTLDMKTIRCDSSSNSYSLVVPFPSLDARRRMAGADIEV